MITALSLEDVAAEIGARRISPVEVTSAALERIERLQPRLNAFITVTADRALDAAKVAEQEIAAGEYRGVLHGVPVAYKDVFATAGVRTTAGSKILEHWIPDEDAEAVARLERAGAIGLGKLGMHEFAYGTTSVNQHYGPVRNPWDPERIAGGSSGGSAVAITTGMAFGALGSDTGGSIRIPASECGCVGVKPTYGRVSVRGMVPLAWSVDHVGPLARTVRDAAVLLQTIAGHDQHEPTSSCRNLPDFPAGIEAKPSELRIGLPRQYFWEGLEAGTEQLLREQIDRLASGGAKIMSTEFPAASDYSRQVGQIISAEAAAYHSKDFPAREADYGVAPQLRRGMEMSAISYAHAMRVLVEARKGGADAALDGVDVLAVPTISGPPPTIEEIRSGSYSVRRTTFTSLLDLTGQPVVTVPCGLTTAGLPTGLSFIARRWDEISALRAARAFETLRGPLPMPPG